jgi:hypothetical protein
MGEAEMSIIKRIRPALVVGLFLALALGFNLTSLAAGPENGSIGKGQAAGQELAQRSGEWQQRAQARFDSMCVFLKLNEKQKKEALTLYQTMRKEMSKVREEAQNGNMERDAARESMQKINTNYQEKLGALLTKDQKALLEKWNEAHPRQGGPRRG